MRDFYERAVFGGDNSAVDAGERELDAVEAGVALGRGRLLHARFLASRRDDPRERALFTRAVELYRRVGDRRGEGEALFWLGVYRQVVRGEPDVVAEFSRSYELAERAGDRLTMSYAVRHLGFVAAQAGDRVGARERLEESLRLREEIGFAAGVAAALHALGDLAAEDGRVGDAADLLDRAAGVARGCEAHGVLRWIEDSRGRLPRAG